MTPVGPVTITDALLLLVFCDIWSSSLSLSFESLDSILISNFHYYFQDGRPTKYYNHRYGFTSAKQSRAFSVMGPSIWNGLPSQLRIFPRALSPAFFLNLRLLFLAMLESGAPLSSPLEEALYKCSV